MGNSSFKYLNKSDIEFYEENTYLSEREIQKLFKIFCDIFNASDYKASEYMLKSAEIENSRFMELFMHIKNNPFKDRIISVFCGVHGTGITFEGLLEMMSVFSENAPFEIKVHYAFKIYNLYERISCMLAQHLNNADLITYSISDFDDDNYLSKEDLSKMISRIVEDSFDTEELKIEQIVDSIIMKADLDKDGKLSMPEFEHIMSKASDFMNTFVMKIL